MPDRRRHRGAHPADAESFAERCLPALRAATRDLSWLRGRGYSDEAALKLVGDRHQLTARQRLAVLRSAASDAAVADRGARRVALAALAGRRLVIDGFNVLITVETALAGGLVLIGRDGCHRDLASVHGTYRRVDETVAAARAIGQLIAGLPARTTWLLDRPVSNSGRLGQLLAAESEAAGWGWEIELHASPDHTLVALVDGVAATHDGVVLDRCGAWIDLAGEAIAAFVPEAWKVDLS